MSEADGAARIGQPVESDDVGWIRDYRAWRRGRLKGVQDSGGVWLGLLTTLLTLLGSVVLFKGGDLVTSVTRNGWFQFFLILLVSLVFVSAILALIAGGSATWGGLGDIPEEGTAEAKTTAAATPPAPSLAEDNETAGGRRAASVTFGSASGCCSPANPKRNARSSARCRPGVNCLTAEKSAGKAKSRYQLIAQTASALTSTPHEDWAWLPHS